MPKITLELLASASIGFLYYYFDLHKSLISSEEIKFLGQISKSTFGKLVKMSSCHRMGTIWAQGDFSKLGIGVTD